MSERVIEVASASADGVDTIFDASGDNTAQAGKANPGALYGLHVDNTGNAAKSYIQFFDAATGDVTVGTTTPKFSLPILGSNFLNLDFKPPIKFSTAITYALTTTPTGGTAPATVNPPVTLRFK